MSIQEMKSQLHQLIDGQNDEVILQEVRQLLSMQPEQDILDELTDAQRAGLEKAREEARQQKGMSVAEFKNQLEKKWPHLKS